jgi:hypothetical protein
VYNLLDGISFLEIIKMPILSKVPFSSSSSSAGPYTVTTGKTNPSGGNGATIMMAGNIRPGTNVSQALSLTTMGYHVGYGSVIATSTTPGNSIAKSQTNSFNKMTAGQYWINGFSRQLAGLASNALAFPGWNYPRTGTNYYQSFIRTGRINLTGGWDYNSGFPRNPTDFVDNLPNGTETFPTRAIPGRIVYLQNGNKTPLRTNYSAKND